MILRCPIGFSMGISCLLYFLLADRFPLMVLAHQLSSGIMSYTYLAIPFFILAGALMNQTGMTQRLFDFALSLVGSLSRGLPRHHRGRDHPVGHFGLGHGRRRRALDRVDRHHGPEGLPARVFGRGGRLLGACRGPSSRRAS